jgi:hypothetical protein
MITFLRWPQLQVTFLFVHRSESFIFSPGKVVDWCHKTTRKISRLIICV